MKTKPTQHSVMKLREIGIQPDILICRTDREIPAEMKDKIAMFCNVDPGSVFTSPGREEHLRAAAGAAPPGPRRAALPRCSTSGRARPRLEQLGADRREGLLRPRRARCASASSASTSDLKESYKSLNEALIHGGIANDVRVKLSTWTARRSRRRAPQALLGDVRRGAGAGRLRRARHRGEDRRRSATRARRRFRSSASASGLQMAVVEFARDVLGLGERQLARVRRADARTRWSRLME